MKAGYFAFPGYHQQENGLRSGYGYDFLSLLQQYTHLKVEYVGYENSWEEMQRMLLDGRIDLLTSARKTLEREKVFDFSMPIGINSAQINVRKNDERFIPGDFAALNGCAIGVLSGNSRNEDTRKFAEERGFSYTVKEYSSVELLQQALKEGQVDAIATSSLRKSSDEKTVAEFAPQKFYVIVRKGDTALLNEINYGLNQMDVNEGNWRDDLYYKNYVAKQDTILAFTQREQAYIKAVQMGDKKITVMARPGRAPYSFVQDGKLVGIMPDFFAKLMAKAGLPYEIVMAKDRDEYGRWQQEHHVNVVMDYHYDTSQPWSDDNGLFTKNFMELTLSRVMRRGFTGDARVVAKIDTQPDKDIREVITPAAEILIVPSAEAAMKAVMEGRADVSAVPTYMVEKFINADPDSNLSYSILKKPIYAATICLSPDTDHELCSILNKCIMTESASILAEYISKYTTVSYGNLSLIHYLKLHPKLVILGAVVLVLLMALIAFLIVKSQLARMQAERLEMERIHAAERHLHAFADMLNAATWSFDVKGDAEIIDVAWSDEFRHMFGFEDETDFPNAIKSWSNRLHPEDRERVDEHFRSSISSRKEGLVYDISFRIQRKTGEYSWYHAYGRTELKPDGTRRLYGIMVDISAEKTIEKQQQELKEEKLRNDIIHDIIHSGKWSFFVNAKDEVIRAEYSDEVQRIIGNDLPNKPTAWMDILHPEDRETAITAFKSAIADHSGNTPYDVIYRMVDRNGNYNWFHSAGRIVRQADGSGEFFGVHINITDQFERQLKQQEQLEAALTESEKTNQQLDEANRHEKLKSDAFSFMLNHDKLENFVEFFSGRILELYGCDQVIYRDIEGRQILKERPGVKPLDFSLCANCPHFEFEAPVYADGFTVMDDCKVGYKGIPVHPDCHVRASLTYLVYEDKKIFGYIALHYLDGTHAFTEKEKNTFDQLAQFMSMVLSRRKQQDTIRRSLAFTNYFIDTFISTYSINLETQTCTVYKRTNKLAEAYPVISNYLETIGEYIAKDVHPDDREALTAFIQPANLKQLLSQQQMVTHVFRDISDGVEKIYSVRVVHGADENNVAFAFEDITEDTRKEQESQKKLQEALESANKEAQRNDLLIDTFNSAKWSYEFNAADEITAVTYSENVYKSTGIKPPDSLAPMGWIERLHPDDRERVLNEFMATIRDHSGKIKYDSTFRLLGSDGIYRWSRSAGRVIRRPDGGGEFFGMSMDMTRQIEDQNQQHKQLEEALAMAQSANRAKTTFLNNMSHDIRTPMNAIIGFTGLAASHIDNKQQVQDYLTKIGQSSDHLLSLINDVLDMSRIESGKMNLDEKEENLPAIIHTLRDIVQADIRAKQHDFFIDTVNVNDENIICDKLRLNQVLLNILSNAIKYTANGGIISMRITEKALKTSGYATYEFCIKDNGMGMDEEFQKTIFDPFTRVKSSTVSGIQGTGLGMAITKNIIDMMGGTIDIKSAPGKGTQMTVTFEFRLLGTPKELPAIPELKGLRGLVVDDDADTCMSLTGMLRDVGMRDEWCVSGKEAVLRAAEAYRIGDHFKVYIIDWLMPDMNGIETTRRIRKVIGDDTPIIILTAYDWSDIEEEAREAGVTAFVSKPMFPSDLHRVLNSCLGKAEDVADKQEDNFDFTGRKVLLVEDNELNREIAVELLEEYGMVVTTAEDGTIAVEKMKSATDGEYDVVLMDIQMPIMNGYEATKAIRALDTTISKIPIIAMTADAFAEDRKLALAAGMNDHITKPINIRLLRQTLARYL